jgi:hypothetical protein
VIGISESIVLISETPNELRIDVAGRDKVEALVHCVATSIRVELSRFVDVMVAIFQANIKELLGDYVMNTNPRQSLESILIKRLYKKKGRGGNLGRVW